MEFTLSRARRVVTLTGTVVACSAVLAVTGPAALAQPVHPASAAPHSVTSRAIPFTAASVIPDGTGKLRVSWDAPGVRDVTVLAGTDATHQHRVVGHGRGTGALTVSAGTGRWFALVPSTGRPLVVTVREVGLASDPNLRDIGGYRTGDGRWVRMGAVYRSQAMALTPGDLAQVNSLGITTDYDLRTPAEAAATPDAVPAGAAYTMLNVLGDTQATMPSITSAAQAQQYMAQTNQQFVTSPVARQAFADLLTGVADDDGASLYHCTAGKDRTGWATAVLLTLLGVPRDTVLQDYLRSNENYYDSPAVQAQLAAMPAAEAAIYQHFLDVEPAYLQAGLDQVTASYGSMAGYATKGLGLNPRTLAKLRQKLLAG